MGRMLDCSWCERADAYGAVSWVSLGYLSGITLGIRLWERCCVWWRSYTFRGIIHLRCAGRKCVGVRDAEASCRGWKSNL